ncbi:MAG: hypothetical protein HYX42_04000 [Polaromonas sp.]|uniref:hypothetical protein n=1 Tax=Polaromonas sp. TaxID=1869339 RepID=UPI0025D3EC05|nr:hypothetical protein [Polaromonas sp.]MBI2725393.1 hypothetical protein [Polaromonas sp.]
MPYFRSPIGNSQIETSAGVPAVGWKIYTYLAGTTTPAATYTDNTGATQQANPMILNSLGVPASNVWMLGGVALKFVITDAAGVVQSSLGADNVRGVNDTTSSVTEWIDSGLVPTYISPTSFSVPNDQTLVFEALRKLKTVNAGGTVYSSVVSAVYSAPNTTITVTNISGALDASLSSVAYGLLSANNPSIPESTLGTAFRTATALFSIPPMTVFGGAATRMAIGTGLNANILATTTPIRLSFPGGIGANGRIDYPGSITADATAFWATLTASSTLYTFYDRNTTTGAITGVFSTLPYIVQDSSVAISTTTGQHTYVTDTNTMYVGIAGVATVVQRVPEGELVTSGVAVTSVTSYAKLRKYTQVWVATLPGLSAAISANHNLGTQEFVGQVEIECTTADGSFTVGQRYALLNCGLSGSSYLPVSISKTRLSMGFSTGDGGKIAMTPPAGGAVVGLTAASWKYRFLAQGTF